MADGAVPGADVVPDPPPRWIVFVFHQNGDQRLYNIPTGATLGPIMAAFCQEQAVDLHDVVFLYDGHRISQYHTADHWEMVNGDFVDVIPLGMGGGAGENLAPNKESKG